MDKLGKISFTKEIASSTNLNLFVLKLKVIQGKNRVNIFAKTSIDFN